MRCARLSSAVAASILMIAVSAFAADIGSVVNNPPEKDSFQIIGANQLAKLMANPDSHLYIYDANPPDVRKSEGMIPGALPLTSAGHYDVAQVLPSNKNAKIVFYCHNLH
ncbi:MAG: rhodanese-like domain-containing protein [Candidatus Binataceae bacterium]